jgi:hypothetical protein
MQIAADMERISNAAVSSDKPKSKPTEVKNI